VPTPSSIELDLRVIRAAQQEREEHEQSPSLLDLAIRAEFVVDWQIEEPEPVAH